MCGGGGGTTSNSVAEFKPPGYTQDLWQDYTQQAGAATSDPFNQFQGQTIAGINSDQNAGFDLAYQRATLGAPDLNAGRGQVTDTANGMYSGSNPWSSQGYTQNVINDNANQMSKAFSVGTAAQNDALFNKSGNYGGSAWAEKQNMDASGLAGQIGQMANQYQMQNAQMGSGEYESERGRQLQAAGLSGQLSQDDWTAAQNLIGVGDARRAYSQDLLTANQNQFNQQQMYPYQQLDILGNALSRASGGVGTNTTSMQQPYNSSPYANLLGAGMAAYGMMQ